MLYRELRWPLHVLAAACWLFVIWSMPAVAQTPATPESKPKHGFNIGKLIVIHHEGANPSGLPGDTGNFALNPTDQADASAAAATMVKFLNHPYITPNTGAIYNPHDKAGRARLSQNLKAALAGAPSPSAMTSEQLQRVQTALLPYARFAQIAYAQKSGKGIVIPPGGVAHITEQGYCLDHSFPAPGGGEQFRLVPVTNLIPKELVPIYNGLVRTGAQNGSSPQGALWFLRGVAQGTVNHPPQIDEGLAAQLEQASPGALQTIKAYDKTKFPKGLLLNINIDPTSYNLFAGSPTERHAAVQATLGNLVALSTPAPQTLMSYSPGFSTLEDGVFAHGYGGGFSATIDVANTTSAPAVFEPGQYVAQAARRVQRLALSSTPNSVEIQGNRVPLITPDELKSLGFDLIPIVGNFKALAQAIYGRDLVTGDDVNRLLELAAILPIIEDEERVGAAALRADERAAAHAADVAGAIERDSLTEAQRANLARYEQKLPANAGPTTITVGADGSITMTATSPGRVPGSYATYTKTMDNSGTTTAYTKTTTGPGGETIHVKDKINN